MGLCRKIDDFIAEKLHWVVTLSNGEIIYQDDDRPGEAEPKAWIRLSKYVKEHNLSIIRFDIEFYTHKEEAAPANAKGYYFVQKVESFSGSETTYHYYIVGSLQGDVIIAKHWLVPAIILTQSETRAIVKDDPCLIVNP